MRKIIALVILLGVSLSASAKLTQFLLRGYARQQDYSKTEWQRQMVDSIYLSIVRNDTVAVSFKMLEGDDELKFSPSGAFRMLVSGGVGDYTLFINRDGYEPLRYDFKVASEGQDVVYLRDIYMEKKRETRLKEVEIVGTAIKMVMKGDTIVYDSAAFNLPEGSTLDALVSQLPGAKLESDGSITVNGRKVSSLLLDGNDFFQGDPEIALKNLPSYVIDKIKVYDKAAKDDYLTHESHTIDDDPTDDNLVMDVIVKKEFSMATIFNVEGGYGPGIHKGGDKKLDQRYIGRAFLIGFGKNYRFSAFGNVNNIKNTSRATSYNKDWGSGGWNNSGEMDLAMGGFDVFYKPSQKLELQADMHYSREDISTQQIVGKTFFYDSGDMYQRNRMETTEQRNHLIANAQIDYRGDNLRIWFRPMVDWMRNPVTTYAYQAMFDRNPVEEYRGAALDTLFNLFGRAAQPSVNLKNSLTSTGYSANNSHIDRLQLKGALNITYAPKSLRGNFFLEGNVTDDTSNTPSGSYAFQTLADPAVEPVRIGQWTESERRSTEVNAALGYDWEKRFMNDKLAHRVKISPGLQYELDRSFEDQMLRREALWQGFNPEERPLPSMTAPENMPISSINAENTLNVLSLDNNISVGATATYNTEVLAPGDSAFNATYYVSVGYRHTEAFRHFSYDLPYLASDAGVNHFSMNRNDAQKYLYASFQLRSNNKVRTLSMRMNYIISTSLISMQTLSPLASSSNPLDIYLPPIPGAEFREPEIKSVRFYLYHYGHTSQAYNNFSLVYEKTDNALAQSAVYNPATGVTTRTAVNVDGNWLIYADYYGNFPFGQDKRWNVNVWGYAKHQNSVDYVSVLSAPVKSLIRTENLQGRVNLSYSLTNGTRFYLGIGSAWQYATSPRKGFSTISATETDCKLGVRFFLPWQIEGETEMSARFRRGYADSSMNTTEWIWNASVQKSILKGALTFKLSAVDLLGQLTSVTYSINAQGRTETWVNSLPRYAMFTVSYRFSFTPKALK